MLTSNRFNRKGFTIVELLIVIVVIGILAAITIVSYNGISGLAENAKTLSAVATYRRALGLYAVEHHAYPINTSACLGNAYANNVCWDGQFSPNATLNSGLLQYIGNLPMPSTLSLSNNSLGGTLFHNGHTGGGAWKLDGVDWYYWIVYMVKGAKSCNQPGTATLAVDH